MSNIGTIFKVWFIQDSALCNLVVSSVYGVQRHIQQYFSYIMVVSGIGGGNRITWRKPLTCRLSLTNFITCFIEYTSPWTGFKLTCLVVIGTDCTGSYKSNYHTITSMTAPIQPCEIALNMKTNTTGSDAWDCNSVCTTGNC